MKTYRICLGRTLERDNPATYNWMGEQMAPSMELTSGWCDCLHHC